MCFLSHTCYIWTISFFFFFFFPTAVIGWDFMCHSDSSKDKQLTHKCKDLHFWRGEGRGGLAVFSLLFIPDDAAMKK